MKRSRLLLQTSSLLYNSNRHKSLPAPVHKHPLKFLHDLKLHQLLALVPLHRPQRVSVVTPS